MIRGILRGFNPTHVDGDTKEVVWYFARTPNVSSWGGFNRHVRQLIVIRYQVAIQPDGSGGSVSFYLGRGPPSQQEQVVSAPQPVVSTVTGPTAPTATLSAPTGAGPSTSTVSARIPTPAVSSSPSVTTARINPTANPAMVRPTMTIPGRPTLRSLLSGPRLAGGLRVSNQSSAPISIRMPQGGLNIQQVEVPQEPMAVPVTVSTASGGDEFLDSISFL